MVIAVGNDIQEHEKCNPALTTTRLSPGEYATPKAKSGSGSRMAVGKPTRRAYYLVVRQYFIAEYQKKNEYPICLKKY